MADRIAGLNLFEISGSGEELVHSYLQVQFCTTPLGWIANFWKGQFHFLATKSFQCRHQLLWRVASERNWTPRHLSGF